MAELDGVDLCGGSRSVHQNFRTAVQFGLARTGDLELAEEFVETGVAGFKLNGRHCARVDGSAPAAEDGIHVQVDARVGRHEARRRDEGALPFADHLERHMRLQTAGTSGHARGRGCLLPEMVGVEGHRAQEMRTLDS